MKLLVIGHSVEDHITENGIDKIKPGGIFYTAIALNQFVAADDLICLNTAVQKENYNLFADVYKSFDKSFIKFVDRIPKVYLTLHDFKERGETYESISQGLNIDIESLGSFDGILINMITGFDVSLDQLQALRKNYSGLIYIDIHTLARGLDENLKREFRPVPKFNEWASSVDIIQANESELKTLSALHEELDIAAEILNYGAKIFIVTKGSLGARLYCKKGNEIISTFRSAVKIKTKNMVSLSGRQVGCGDVFGAVFFYHYIKTKNVDESLSLANLAAGCSASYKEISDFKDLKKDVLQRFN